MAATGSRRIDNLSRAKPVPEGFLEDRRSLYWVDNRPAQPGPNGVTQIVGSSRVQELAKARHMHADYIGHRPSPIWQVRPGALNARSTERLDSLSQPKQLSGQYQYSRSPYTIVGDSALMAQPSERLCQIAQPKVREDPNYVFNTEWGESNPVPVSALRAVASERVDHLSQPKMPHQQYHGERPVQWQVTDSALKALASLRLQQMSRPRSRTMVKDDYDPYKVTNAARHARGTPRIDELCAPIERKVRKKKAA